MDSTHTYQYTIGVVARRTQTHTETLRVWERRYALVVPGRSDTGRRLYSEADIIKISLVKQLTDAGHPVSALAKLSIDALRERLNAPGAELLGKKPGKLSKCRVLFMNESLRLRVGRDLMQFSDIEIIDQARADELAVSAKNADLLIMDLATVNDDSLDKVQQSLAQTGCAAALLIFNFGTKTAVSQLERAGVPCLKGAFTAAEIHRACLSAIKPSSTASAAPARPAVVPPRFDAAQLARLVGISSTIACECPNQLAELIVSLNAFERYSSECANRDDKDAQLHAQLGESAGLARVILEESLSRLIEIEGIVI